MSDVHIQITTFNNIEQSSLAHIIDNLNGVTPHGIINAAEDIKDSSYSGNCFDLLKRYSTILLKAALGQLSRGLP
jgi:hypothetical protein